jgi:hypothetical protein
MHLQINAAEAAAYNKIDEALQIWISRDIKQNTQTLTFSLINGFYFIAGFKAEIRAGLMKTEGQLTTIATIKANWAHSYR